MRMLGWVINVMEQAVSSGERVFNVLDTGSIVVDKEDPLIQRRRIGECEV